MFSYSFFSQDKEKDWDEFVLFRSMNGSFLQTREFINYHKNGKFDDASVCVYKGSELVAVILACVEYEGSNKILFAHRGTTAGGGVIVSKTIYHALQISELFSGLEAFLSDNHFTAVYIKTPGIIYQKEDTSLIDYFFSFNNYFEYKELNFYLRICDYNEDVLLPMTSNSRRCYRSALRQGLIFKSLETPDDIKQFYIILKKNHKRLGVHTIHSLEDLYDLKYNRFPNDILFFGVYANEELISGSMVFILNDAFHTQYLASDEEYLNMYPMNFLITSLIGEAKKHNSNVLSLGICTENQGKDLNFGLSRFKEGFGARYCVNRTYIKSL